MYMLVKHEKSEKKLLTDRTVNNTGLRDASASKNEDTDEEKTDHPLDAHSIYLVKMPKQQNQGRLLESFQKGEKQFTLASLASFQIHKAAKARVPSTLASRSSPLRM